MGCGCGNGNNRRQQEQANARRNTPLHERKQTERVYTKALQEQSKGDLALDPLANWKKAAWERAIRDGKVQERYKGLPK